MVCPENSNHCTHILLQQTVSDFNLILHQQYNIQLQTNHQISMKLVYICKSYSKFNEVTRKHEVSTIDNVQTCDCQNAQVNIFKVEYVF